MDLLRSSLDDGTHHRSPKRILRACEYSAAMQYINFIRDIAEDLKLAESISRKSIYETRAGNLTMIM